MISQVTNPALVFNCYFNGLSIIQALGRQGVKVYALDNTRSVGTWSRYAHFRRCPDPMADEAGFISFLMKIGPAFSDKPVLFPTNDHWASAISKHKKQLEQYYIPCVADDDTVSLLINKDRFYSWAIEKGYPVPKLYGNNEITDAKFPLIAKPKYRRISNLSGDAAAVSRILDSRRMTVLNNMDEYERYLEENKEILQYIIFQEYIPGMADCMYTVGIYADKKSEILSVFTGRKVRGFPPDIGDCMVGQAEQLPPDVVKLVKKIAGELHYHGIAEFEFKKNPDNGEYKLIEINPRSWSWIGITPACGVNLPWIAYADLTGAEPESYRESTVDHGDIKFIRLIDDFKNCLYANKKAGFPQYHMNMRQWLQSLRADKRVYAGFNWDDPVPGLYQIIQQAGQLLSACFQKTADLLKLRPVRQRNG